MIRNKLLSITTGLILFFILMTHGGTVYGDNTGQEPDNPGVKPEQTAEGDEGMVVTAHPEASKIGADVLRNGGNATDAAVAIQYALNVAEPMMSGIGGGGFMMHYNADSEDVSIINSRERAPDGATPDMFMDKSNTVQDPNQFLLSAIEMNDDGGGQFHIGEIRVDDLDESSSGNPAFYEDFEDEEEGDLDSEKFGLFERGTTFRLDDNGGKVNFGSPVHGNKTSFGRATPEMDELKNGELNLKFRTDDPGDDRRLRVWLRADDYRPGSTFAKNGYGVEINTDTHEIKLIQSKDSESSYLKTIKYDTSTDWQSLKFRVNDNKLKVKLWQDDTEEPDKWDIETNAGSVMPFQDRVENGRSVGIPGTLKGLDTALSKWGTMSMDELIEPATELADDGVEVNWVLADAIEGNEEKLSRSAAKDVFLPEGEPLKEGDKLVQKDLADTFEMIAEEGVEAFYEGEIGDTLADVVQDFDGSMEQSDLKEYDVTEDEPEWGDYEGYDIATMPPPSSGGLTTTQLLNMFEELNLTQYDVRSPEKYHRIAEAMHLAYADRSAYMGDPEYVDVPSEGLLNPDYIQNRVDSIDPAQANPDVEAGEPWDYQDGEAGEVVEQIDDKTNGETTHFTVADKWGNQVSYTTTNEQLFGSGIMVPGYGVMLNNELTDFDAKPGGANEVQPNKRPLSSMSPSIILDDGKPYMTMGSPGGTRIIASVSQTILNTIGYDMDLKDAIEEPRIYSSDYPDIQWEYGIPDKARNQLEQLGHEWEADAKEMGNVNSLLYDKDKEAYVGAADSSREGMAIGISSTSLDYIQDLVDEYERFDEITDDDAAKLLHTHLASVAHYKDAGQTDKAVKHLDNLKKLIEHQREKNLITNQAYDILKTNVQDLLEEWQK